MRPDRKRQDGGDPDHAKQTGLGSERSLEARRLSSLSEGWMDMQISDNEVKRLLKSRDDLVREIESIADGIDDPEFTIDPQMVRELTQKVLEMPDREDRIAELKAEIAKGTYRPTAEQIVEAMIRRTIADRAF